MKCRKCKRWMSLDGKPRLSNKKVTYNYKCECGQKGTIKGER